MNFVHEVFNSIINQPDSTWTTLGSYLGGSTLVASLLQIVKHKFKIADARNLIVFLLGFFSFIAAFADFLIQNNPNLSALPWLGHVTGVLVGGAVVVHRFAVSPAYYKLAAKFQNFGKALKEVESEKITLPEVPVSVLNSAPTATHNTPATALPVEADLAQFQI